MFKELLEKEFEISANDEIKAEQIYSKLIQNSDNQDFYRWSLDKNTGENYVASFFPQIFYNKFYRNDKLLSISGNIYKYNDIDGKYSKYEIKKDILKKLNQKDSNINKNPQKVVDIINMEKDISPDSLNLHDDYVNFKNGMLNLKTKTLEPHSSEFLSTKQIQSNYKKIDDYNINNSKFMSYLQESFYKEDFNTIQEWLGYCLCNNMGGQKFCVLSGSGKNGKGTLVRIINSFFEKDFVSSVDLSKLSKQEYAARLYGKALNVCADISDSFISDSSMIKQLTGEDTIEAKELYSNPFSFINKAKIMFASNKLPQTSDKTIGFLRRLLIISCDKIPTKKIDKLSEILVSEELELIISWSIEGLYRLIENNFEFSESNKTKENIENYKIQNDNIVSFIKEYCHITNDNSQIPKNEFSMMYKQYCKINSILPQSSKNINNYFKEINVKEYRAIIRSWKGIQWDVSVKEIQEQYNLDNRLIGGLKYEIKGQQNANLDIVDNDSENAKKIFG